VTEQGVHWRDAVIAGFESGRVAMFRLCMPYALLAQKRATKPNVHGESESACPMGLGVPLLSAKEPLIFECPRPRLDGTRERRSPVVDIQLHPTAGIISMGADGMVLALDIVHDTINWSIGSSAGPGATLVAADMALDLELLVVAGHRGNMTLWQCLTQTKAGVIEPPEVCRSPVLLVRYLASQAFVVSVHKKGGTVLIWDILRLELHRSFETPGCSQATCAILQAAGTQPRCQSLLVFGPNGVTQRQLVEESHNHAGEPEDAVTKPSSILDDAKSDDGVDGDSQGALSAHGRRLLWRRSATHVGSQALGRDSI